MSAGYDPRMDPFSGHFDPLAGYSGVPQTPATGPVHNSGINISGSHIEGSVIGTHGGPARAPSGDTFNVTSAAPGGMAIGKITGPIGQVGNTHIMTPPAAAAPAPRTLASPIAQAPTDGSEALKICFHCGRTYARPSTNYCVVHPDENDGMPTKLNLISETVRRCAKGGHEFAYDDRKRFCNSDGTPINFADKPPAAAASSAAATPELTGPLLGVGAPASAPAPASKLTTTEGTDMSAVQTFNFSNEHVTFFGYTQDLTGEKQRLMQSIADDFKARALSSDIFDIADKSNVVASISVTESAHRKTKMEKAGKASASSESTMDDSERSRAKAELYAMNSTTITKKLKESRLTLEVVLPKKPSDKPKLILHDRGMRPVVVVDKANTIDSDLMILSLLAHSYRQEIKSAHTFHGADGNNLKVKFKKGLSDVAEQFSKLGIGVTIDDKNFKIRLFSAPSYDLPEILEGCDNTDLADQAHAYLESNKFPAGYTFINRSTEGLPTWSRIMSSSKEQAAFNRHLRSTFGFEMEFSGDRGKPSTWSATVVKSPEKRSAAEKTAEAMLTMAKHLTGAGVKKTKKPKKTRKKPVVAELSSDSDSSDSNSSGSSSDESGDDSDDRAAFKRAAAGGAGGGFGGRPAPTAPTDEDPATQAAIEASYRESAARVYATPVVTLAELTTGSQASSSVSSSEATYGSFMIKDARGRERASGPLDKSGYLNMMAQLMKGTGKSRTLALTISDTGLPDADCFKTPNLAIGVGLVASTEGQNLLLALHGKFSGSIIASEGAAKDESIETFIDELNLGLDPKETTSPSMRSAWTKGGETPSAPEPSSSATGADL